MQMKLNSIALLSIWCFFFTGCAPAILVSNTGTNGHVVNLVSTPETSNTPLLIELSAGESITLNYESDVEVVLLEGIDPNPGGFQGTVFPSVSPFSLRLVEWDGMVFHDRGTQSYLFPAP